MKFKIMTMAINSVEDYFRFVAVYCAICVGSNFLVIK